MPTDLASGPAVLEETAVSAAPGAPSRRKRWTEMSRGRAFLGHLAISAVVVGVACAAVLFFWYPAPYFEAAGASRVLRVLVAVDLVLGPALTLVVFKPGKKSLVFDMSCIAIMQLAAFVYGVTVLYGGRPYYNVFAVDRFHLLARADVAAASLEESFVALGKIGVKPARGPLLVAAVVPEDRERQQQLLAETVFEGKPDIERRPEFWHSFAEHAPAALAKAKPLAALRAARPEAAEPLGVLAVDPWL
jgi:hypothetical protein